ncbi:hypothetical protein APE_0614.1 [Aeropyrum pernix K1]|uniref:Uncharacterized protein n=1 Tax=Aeropyrum pernix (strain ATCC 700893 / DSM 11879 / JCM 9820 / NBRC 100138 / K1) TaxID=272557 RepID=Q9YEG2_AERPE|nr:hypothetical protein APE_0614.1 [Aeropyrum pernix K1]
MLARRRRGLSEVYGALVAVAVAVAVAAALMSVGGRTAGLIAGAGEAASQSIAAASNPLYMEAWVEAGALKVRFYSPGAPVESVVVLKPGEGVAARVELPEPAVEGVVDAMEGYDCSPVILGVETVGGGLRLHPTPYTCPGSQEGGGGGLGAAVNIAGLWFSLAGLGEAWVISVGAWEPIDAVFKVEIELDRSCSPRIAALGAEVWPDGSGGYGEERLGTLDTGVGAVEVYGFALCTGDGLWAGVRLDPPGMMVLRGEAEASGTIAYPGKPRKAVEAVVYSDGLETVSGRTEAWMVSPRYTNGATQAQGAFATATGIVALLHSSQPGEARASLEATITLTGAAPLALSTHTTTLPHPTPARVTLLACRDQAPSLGIDALLNPPPIIGASIAGVTRTLEPGETLQASWTPGLEITIAYTPRETMGTPLKPLAIENQGADGRYTITLTPAPSPCGAPAKPLLIIQDTPQGRTLAHLQVQGARLKVAPAEAARAGGYSTVLKAWIDPGKREIQIYGTPTQINPQQTYAAVKTGSPPMETDIIISQ